ncbi:azurin [Algibacter sp. PT7-4]|uniref:azurin n=1 Tax=Algibacter ulvanivorans TaxID=3400999 RepID=UPI003AB0B202
MKVIKITVLIVFSIFLIACGEKTEKKNKGFSYENKPETSKQVESNPNNIVITGNDAMQFNKKVIRVKAGKKVKVTLKHIGKMGKNVMGHNFVLLKQGVNLTAFGNLAASASDNSYIPKNTNNVIAHTKMLGGGETAVIEFDAPKVGTYQFLCSFPGHYALMKGEFIVE